MPLYEYKVLDSDGSLSQETVERLYKAGQAPDTITSSDGRIAKRIISAHASTQGQWSSSWGCSYGVNGSYNRALDKTFYSRKEERQYAESKGMTHLSDFDKHFIDDRLDSIKEQGLKEERAYNNYVKQVESWL